MVRYLTQPMTAELDDSNTRLTLVLCCDVHFIKEDKAKYGLYCNIVMK